MRLLVGWVRAAHAAPTVVVTLVAVALALTTGSPAGVVLVVGLAVLTGQLSIGWSNDAVDAARDLAVGRSDKPVVTGVVRAEQLWRGALLALGLCVPLSLATGVVPGILHVVAVLMAWAYNLRLKSTAWSWLPYAVSFGLLPVFVVLAAPGAQAVHPALPAAGALLGVGAHLANVLPDLEDDAATGVHGLPHRWGRSRTAVVAPVVLAGGVGCGVWLVAPTHPLTTLVLCAVAVPVAVLAAGLGLRRTRSRLPFALTLVLAVLCVVAIVAAGRDAVVG